MTGKFGQVTCHLRKRVFLLAILQMHMSEYICWGGESLSQWRKQSNSIAPSSSHPLLTVLSPIYVFFFFFRADKDIEYQQVMQHYVEIGSCDLVPSQFFKCNTTVMNRNPSRPLNKTHYVKTTLCVQKVYVEVNMYVTLWSYLLTEVT